ncbi:hypothetical protein ACPEIF_05190 [Streptomyces sp. NPDC012600]|uniref:Transmembrane protein n=2 Tax=Streptomyces TaxID=1883 RepID=A0ABU2VYI6_9ACTN|nr:hypothetical protein [Streptomyces griseus]MDT0490652.1 hypothetical protein [Streptomyces griseus]
MRSLAYDLEFREQSTRIRDWGAGLLLLAALLWGWCGFLLLTDYSVETSGGRTVACSSRLFTEGSTANEGRARGDYCAAERDWPEVLAVLWFSVPVSIVGTALFTTGLVSKRMSAHAQAVRELDRLAERPTRGPDPS